MFYTGDEIVTTQIKDSTATIMSKTKWKHDIKIYSGSYPLYLPFTNRKSTPLPIESDFTDEKHLFKFIGEENLNNVKCYHIQEKEIPEQDINLPIQTIKIEYHFWISKANFIPIQFSYDIVGLQNNDTIGQSNRYFLTKYELNSLKDSNIFTLQSISLEYKIKEYNPIKEDDRLPIGTVAPNWQLISLANQKVSLTDFKNKVVLIDFFFKSCYPCIQSLLALQALHKKYSPKGLSVIGIDPTNESGTELTAFLEKHGVNYTVLVHGEDVAKDYHVTGIPTLYLIDKNGKIIFTELGYNKDLEKTIELLLLKNL
ncbi:MAG: TlpA disulfide reductase family protein [Saprospiraceae bacterium]